MLSHLADLPWNLKIAALATSGALLADSPESLTSWENLGVKGMLTGAVFFAVRHALATQKAKDEAEVKHAAELKATWDAHRADHSVRETKTLEVIGAVKQGLEQLADLSQQLVDFHTQFGRHIIESAIKKPNLP